MKTFIEDLQNQISGKKAISQDRAQIAINNIEDSFEGLIKSNHHEELSLRNIAKKSGYSVGTIYRYFKKIDHLFINQFLRLSVLSHEELSKTIKSHSPEDTVEDLVTKVTDHGFKHLLKRKPFILRMTIRYVLRNSNYPERLDSMGDHMLTRLYEIIENDTSGTFLKMNHYEIELCMRAFRNTITSPFFRCDTFAGSKTHYQTCLYVGIRLFKKQS